MKATNENSQPRHITILISPSGEEWFDAYGPMTKDKSKATLFFTNPNTLRAPARFGNDPGFWSSEREAAAKARRDFKGWTFRHESQNF